MPSLTVRIGAHAHQTLKTLAQTAGQSLQTTLEMAIEEYRRKAFFDALDAGYRQMRERPHEWHEERAIWDQTLADGFEELDAKRPSRRRAAHRLRARAR